MRRRKLDKCAVRRFENTVRCGDVSYRLAVTLADASPFCHKRAAMNDKTSAGSAGRATTPLDLLGSTEYLHIAWTRRTAYFDTVVRTHNDADFGAAAVGAENEFGPGVGCNRRHGDRKVGVLRVLKRWSARDYLRERCFR